MSLKIIHDQEKRQFSAEENGVVCYIDYALPNENTIDLQHTIVPKELGGKGYAGELAEYVLNYAEKKGLKVIPTCTYIQAYFKKHPEKSYLLATK